VLSERSACQFSFSEEELLPLSVGVLSPPAICEIRNEERFARFPPSIARRGELSVSDEDKLVIVGGGGDTPDFLERNPAWNRLAFGLMSIDGSGAVGTGEEPREALETSACRYDGSGGGSIAGSAEETSGVPLAF
jgi:hypothetical protein